MTQEKGPMGKILDFLFGGTSKESRYVPGWSEYQIGPSVPERFENLLGVPLPRIIDEIWFVKLLEQKLLENLKSYVKASRNELRFLNSGVQIDTRVVLSKIQNLEKYARHADTAVRCELEIYVAASSLEKWIQETFALADEIANSNSSPDYASEIAVNYPSPKIRRLKKAFEKARVIRNASSFRDYPEAVKARLAAIAS